MAGGDLANPAPERLYPIAGRLCLFGVFLQMMISGGVLFALGIHYATFNSMKASEGGFYEKIHPGTYFIYLGFFAMLWGRMTPGRELQVMFREHLIASFLLLWYLMILVIMVGRSGPGGLAFIPDSHMTAVICAIVLSHLPVQTCRKAAYFFIAFAAFNGLTGIVEGVGHFRVIPYNEEWPVAIEDTFRASAFEGHPLENAVFTSLALFTTLAMRFPVPLKAALVGIFLISLVAFGGRAGLGVSLFSLLIWSVPAVLNFFRRQHSLPELLAMAAAIVAVPAAVTGGLYVALNSEMGERIATHAHWDNSAGARLLVLKPLDYMTDAEMAFGMSPQRLENMIIRVDQSVGAKAIENPWVLMFVQMGWVPFPIWLALTLAFAWTLARGKPLPLKLVVFNYFAVGSTFVSFGTKDAMYPIMVFAVTCASRALAARPKEEVSEVASPRPFTAGAA